MRLFLCVCVARSEVDLLKRYLAGTDIDIAELDQEIYFVFESKLHWNLNLTDADAISAMWAKANEVIAVTNGAVILEGLALSKIVLQSIKYTGANNQLHYLPNQGSGYLLAMSPRMHAPDTARFISIALRDAAAAKVLRLYSRELDWVNLYRIYEIIRLEINKDEIALRGWAAKSDMHAFCGSANTPSVSGDNSRHGTGSGTPKLTMNLVDARQMIGKLLRAWLNSKS